MLLRDLELSELEQLRLDGNKLSRIAVGTFERLSNLEDIGLSDNEIQILVDKSAFSDLVKL
ncbi:uncharacterized protein LOC112552866 [Pogonomyrmex barbatus]|uniref:Uncharacterized protein LOC112552866 n=1 Tax=Pogonomyrmex barbatus TaxID=144034 RepID=A0A8N1S865_9HYME|nr:uncharacterized protein LOC112552866 [Pogonomyrmex barbatus]